MTDPARGRAAPRRRPTPPLPHAAAARALLPVLARLPEIGGSHAQRDLFEQITDDALLHAGGLEAAQGRPQQRLAGNPDSVPTRGRLASLYRGLGLPELAVRLTE